MKRVIIVALMAICCNIDAAAQFKLLKRQASRKYLQTENIRLRKDIDSLKNLVDSLQQRKYVEDSAYLAILQGNNDTTAIPEKQMEYTAEVSDSLMGLWYKHNKPTDFTTGEYNMDSVRLSSSVPDAELVRRLKEMNPFISLPFNETVKNYMVLYSEKMPAKMGRMLGLCEYYMPLFEETFLKYDLPVELKYMAIIESGLNPVATSRAGARGIWQFMYSTARIYGLKINSFVDERLDVEKAVDAAARYLRDSYKVFGDWCLAISSYNCGAGNVQKAIRRAGSREFWDVYHYLPRETRGYMPALVGAMYAMRYYKEYGIVPEEIGHPAVTDTFEIRRNLHFRQITDVVGVPMDILKELNPQYVHDIIPGNEGCCILELPFNWSGAFMAADRDSLYNHKSSTLLDARIIKNIKESGNEVRTAYRVKNGDYLGKIAVRYHVSVSQIKKWNHLRSDNLRIGQVIYIYHRGAGPKTAPAKSSSASSSKSKTGASAAAPQAASKPIPSDSPYTVYTVKSGDSFYLIAKNYPGISAQNIMDFNHMTSSGLKPGMKLKIPSVK